MAKSEKNEQYSVEETERRLDRALRRSLQMPPPARGNKLIHPQKAKRATSKNRVPSA
jgi:hypothetical protein